MAKKQNTDLLQTLRGAGLRKKVAHYLRDTADHGKQPNVIGRSVKNLRAAARELEKRSGSSRRSDAAKKGVATRKRNAAKRSAAARKGAKTRARAK